MFNIHSKRYRFAHSITTTAISTFMLTFILTAVNHSNEARFPIDIWLKTWALVFVLSSLLSSFLPRVTDLLLRKIFSRANKH